MTDDTHRVMVGGKAMNFYGSNRLTSDIDYLVWEPGRDLFYQHDDGDIINAAAHPVLRDIWQEEQGRQIVSVQGLLELKAFAFINHCQNGHFRKSYDDEYDIKFLVDKFGLQDVPVIRRHMGPGEYQEVKKIIDMVLEHRRRAT